MKTWHLLILLVAAQPSGCLPKVRVLSDEEGASGSGRMAGSVAGARECLNTQGCPAGETCCAAGLLGRCTALESAADCPLPDLRVSIPANVLMTIQARVFAEDNVADRCALEKRCVGALGARRLLRFPTRIANLGDADLVLGAPGTSPGFTEAECDGQAYLADYLHYELLDPSTRAVAAEGHMQALCPLSANGFVSRFDCERMGLWRGFSETYGTDSTDCQWIDITDVSPGAYRLRVSINPARTWPDRDHENDSVERPMVLPSLEDPLVSCPRPYDGLSGFGTERECGWSVAGFFPDAGAPPVILATCTAGQPVTVGCGACAGNPMLRVCEGNLPCSAGAALGSGFVDAYELFGDSPCASVDFTCPPSGSYTTLQAPFEAEPLTLADEGFFLLPLECRLAEGGFD